MTDVAIVTDLRSKLPSAARDQGVRPTCLAFAASDAHSGIRGDGDLYSPEHCFYEAHRVGGTHPSDGAHLTPVLSVVETIGQVLEVDWPYLPTLPSDLSTWNPPADLQTFYRSGHQQHLPDIATVAQLISSGKPPLLTLRISDSLYVPSMSGIVDQLGSEEPDPLRRHAVVAVGLGVWNSSDVVLIRNSWGSGWGLGGHAWLTSAFLGPRLDSVTTFLGG